MCLSKGEIMDKEKLKKELKEELKLFSIIAKRDLANGFTIDQVTSEVMKLAQSFYGARIDFDSYATDKVYFIGTYVNQIIKGELEEEYLEEFSDDIKTRR